MSPPECVISPSGPIQIALGESYEFDVCGESLVGGDVDILPIDGPAWCSRLRGSQSGGCETYTISPTEPGEHTLWFRVVDDENDMETDLPVTVRVVGSDCDDPPLCDIIPTGPAMITLGESIDIEVGAESLCESEFGVVSITDVNGPDWCLNLGGGGADGRQFVNYTCTPPTAGMHTLTFRATDSESGLSCERSITIEVNEPEVCMEAPLCDIIPTGPAKITLGESIEIQFGAESLCESEFGVVDLGDVDGPDWCLNHSAGGSGGRQFVNYTCTPPTTGMHTLTFRATDTDSGLSCERSITIEVNEPGVCMDPPSCNFDPPGPIKLEVGQTGTVYFDIFTGCDDHGVDLGMISGDADFCTLEDLEPLGAGAMRATFSCAPESEDVGMRMLTVSGRDTTNNLTTQCSLMIEVNGPCDDPPICTISPQGPITAYVGEEFSFEVCGDSQCDAGVEITPLNLPDWCSESDLRFMQHCVQVTCTPPNNVEGSYTFNFEVEDTDNGQKTTCSVDVEVVCRLEPLCYFTETGPIRVEVGEEIDFEFCGIAACIGHKARIEMSSRPPFIEPAGHRKGGVDEEICLPIKGTPGPEDVGSWRVRITAKDLDTGIETECDIRIIVEGGPDCLETPDCAITPADGLAAQPGDSGSIEICGSTFCENGTVMIELLDAPEFCGPFDAVFSEPGVEACAMLDCTIPDDAEHGEYIVRFLVTDQENGISTVCETSIVVGPPIGCVEVEPNNDLASCTELITGECLDLGCGSTVVGVLDNTGNDRDYYCISGLSPFADYRVTVIGGVDVSGTPVCAMLACVEPDGQIIKASSGGGAIAGYPSIDCASDGSGSIRIAVSGCDDTSLGGPIEGDALGAGHGSTGSYQFAVAPMNNTELDIACHADMNNDGMVNSADLGMLIGVFGEHCDP